MNILNAVVAGVVGTIVFTAVLMMGMIPMMHVGIKSGTVQAPGLWMTNNGGVKAFMGGLVGHMIFGAVTALVYAAL